MAMHCMKTHKDICFNNVVIVAGVGLLVRDSFLYPLRGALVTVSSLQCGSSERIIKSFSGGHFSGKSDSG